MLPVRQSRGPSPQRLPDSLRRTTSLDVTWPDGQSGPMRLLGRARDLLSSGPEIAARTIAEDSFEAVVAPDWRFSSIAAMPARQCVEALVGQSGRFGFRKALRELLGDEQDRATPLALVLDDVPGAAIVSSVAWPEWDADWQRNLFGDVPLAALVKAQEGVCIAHAPGSTAQDPDRDLAMTGKPDAVDFVRADDPEGWHALPPQDGAPGFRRARRIDIRLADRVVIDAEFQDSAAKPGGGRIAVHEYGLTVTANPENFEILSIDTEPRVLPHPECPGVSANLPRLLGVRLDALRREVPVSLAGIAGCTHLNDALRALADVPALLRHLARAR
jgi:hypothetical protein